VLAPGGRLIVVDLAPHDRTALLEQMAHRRLGFGDAAMEKLLNDVGLPAGAPLGVPTHSSLGVRIWQAQAPNNVFAPTLKVLT
jgi:ArsR family transcriptional regulator